MGTQFSLTASCFSVEDLARYSGKTPNTVRKWFTKPNGDRIEGVRLLPRGSQSPHMLIPPDLVRDRFREFGFTEEELKQMFEAHEAHLAEESAARITKSLSARTKIEVKPSAPKRRGRPPGVKRRRG